ncbi:hypothetical protein ACM7G8_21045 [Pseudomonas aeruginosa]
MKTVIFPEVLVRAAQLEGGRLEGAGLTVGELLAGLAGSILHYSGTCITKTVN